MTNYQIAKRFLYTAYLTVKDNKDKPMIREVLNDTCDSLVRSNGLKLSEYQTNLLSNYCCKLHPK